MLQGCKQGGECLIYVVARKIPILSTSFPPPTIRNMGIYSEDLYTIRHSALFYFCIG